MAGAERGPYMDDLSSQAENAARRGEQGKVYKITKMVCGKYRGTNHAPIKPSKAGCLPREQADFELYMRQTLMYLYTSRSLIMFEFKPEQRRKK
ncbi:hypothetical protein OS493_000496 [Desmophyllum pertusum]|uniref:Uncharacterized protein n=1 Tax=Desmophyllum pertusum TaxID=174260 RepID=A0A9X0A7F3_9CNID|nr:hypothetical protein OS493_000496 [Desmophyllum pertusum]